MNRIAIVALITGLLGMVVLAIGLGIAALVQAGRRNERGRGLAVLGLAASAVWIAAAAVAVAAATGEAPEDRGSRGQPRASTLQPGACFYTFEERDPKLFMERVQCGEPHEGEITARVSLPDGPFPGEAEVRARARELCDDRARFLAETGRADEFMLHTDRPDQEAWKRGERTVTCALRYVGPGTFTSSLEELRIGPRPHEDLVAGNCIRSWDEYSSVVVECTGKYRMQVFAIATARGEEFPSRKEMKEQADEFCARHATRIWRTLPRPDVEPVYFSPDKSAWYRGDRRIVCMMAAVKGTLTGSLMPE